MSEKQESSVLVDALPYIDLGYDQAARESAQSMVAEECKRFRPTKDYLSHLPPPVFDAFETSLMHTEMQRIKNQRPMEMMDTKRYELQGPSQTKMNDLSAWTECVENSKAQLEHQALRIANLDLMQEFGSEAWKSFNITLQTMLDEAKKHLDKIRKQLQDLNYQRKQKQTQAGDRLKTLESAWVGLITKNYEIERALVDIESEIEFLQKKV